MEKQVLTTQFMLHLFAFIIIIFIHPHHHSFQVVWFIFSPYPIYLFTFFYIYANINMVSLLSTKLDESNDNNEKFIFQNYKQIMCLVWFFCLFILIKFLNSYSHHYECLRTFLMTKFARNFLIFLTKYETNLL